MRDDPMTEDTLCRWQPFCEIASAIGPLIGAGISLIGGSMASGAAKEAAGTQVEAARIAADLGREGLAFQKDVFNIGRADLSPYRATGGAALHTLSNMFIPGGQGTVQLQGRLNELKAERARLAGGGTTATQAPVQTMGSGASPMTGGNLAYIPGAGLRSTDLIQAALSGRPGHGVLKMRDELGLRGP